MNSIVHVLSSHKVQLNCSAAHALYSQASPGSQYVALFKRLNTGMVAGKGCGTYSAVLTGKKAKGGDETPWMDRLVDVLLSLLASVSGSLPSAPLRDAAEGLFRVFADHLTPTGEPAACKAVNWRIVPAHLPSNITQASLCHLHGASICKGAACLSCCLDTIACLESKAAVCAAWYRDGISLPPTSSCTYL